MDGVPQTSFIPRKPVADTATAHKGTGGKRFVAFSVLVFVFIALICGALFAYQYYLNGILATTETSLNQTLNQFDPNLIAQMANLNTRLDVAQTILQNHVALSQFFSFLGGVTVHSVQFTSFSLTNTSGSLAISLGGQAASFGALEAQQLQLAQDTSGFITDPTITGIALTNNGSVAFTLSGTISPNAVSYQQEIDGPPGSSSASSGSSAAPASSTPQTQTP